MKTEHILVGETVVDVKVAKDKQALKFTLADGRDIIAKVDGDCCSHSWIEHIELPTETPFKVISADSLDMNKEPDEKDGDYVQFYGFQIKTDKGDMIIDYRNSSNGYYGGNIWFPSREPEEYNGYYGGVYGQNVSEQEWQEVTE
jgi:hypothetical protein